MGLKDLCLGFSLHMRGKESSDADKKKPEPTVVVLVRESSRYDWTHVREELQQVVRLGGCDLPVEL